MHRRNFHRLAAAALATPFLARQARAQDARTVRFVHVKAAAAAVVYFYERFAPPGLKIEIIGVDVPADAKNALLSGSADIANAGIGTAISASVNGEPVVVFGDFLDGSINITGRADQAIDGLRGLKGKRVGLQAGSTQELVFNARLRQEGMSIRDVQVVRLTFGEMAQALIRGDIDAFVGTEPSSGVAVTSGAGKVVEYPYSTAMGKLNAALLTRPEVLAEKRDLVRGFLLAHARASEFLRANPAAFVDMGVERYGVRRDAMEVAVRNVEPAWRIDDAFKERAGHFAQAMLEAKQIRRLPDLDRLIDRSVSDEVAKQGLA